MRTNTDENAGQPQPYHSFCDLHGDPSMHTVTNVDLADKKLDIMKAISKTICAHTGKPEIYIAVSIIDKASVIFGGSDAPTALGNMYSIAWSDSYGIKWQNDRHVTGLLELLKVQTDFGRVNDAGCNSCDRFVRVIGDRKEAQRCFSWANFDIQLNRSKRPGHPI